MNTGHATVPEMNAYIVMPKMQKGCTVDSYAKFLNVYLWIVRLI